MTDRSKGKQRNTTGEFSLTYAIASLATRTQHKHSDRYTFKYLFSLVALKNNGL